MKCRGCTVTIPDDPTYANRAFVVDGEVFCKRDCAASHALAEYERYRGALRYIASRTNGKASGIASQVLNSNAPPSHTLPARNPYTRKTA